MHQAVIGFIWSFIITSMFTIAIVLLVSPSFIVDSINEERDYYTEFLFEETEEIINQTNTTFAKFKPAIEVSEEWFHIEEDEWVEKSQNANDALGQSAKTSIAYFREIHDSAWNLIYQSVQRFYLFMALLPIALGIIIPALIDGAFVREIKKREMGFTSPVRYTYAFVGTMMLLLGGLIMLFVPVAIPIYVIGIWAVLISYTLKVAASNLLKKF